MRPAADTIVAAVCVTLFGMGGDASLSATRGTTHRIVIENLQFNPAHLTVRPGDRIVWVNQDLFPHTVTAAGKAFDSGSIAASASWTYHAAKRGQFAYVCTFHPTMKGAITVE
jgi:plastocyanin